MGIDRPPSTHYQPTQTNEQKQVTANGAPAFGAGKDLVFPAATVRLSAAMVKLGSAMVRAYLPCVSLLS